MTVAMPDHLDAGRPPGAAPRTRARGGPAGGGGRRAGPLVPLVVTVLFAGIVAALLWLG